MSPGDIAVRKPVWVAMSDLFLDTDVRLNYSYVARTLAQSPFTLAELKRIFDKEVAPAVGANLMCVAGEWAGFDEEWLVSKILRRFDNITPSPSSKPAGTDWKAVAVLVERLRSLDPVDWPRRVRLWEQLLKLFMDLDPQPGPFEESPTELEAVWRDEMWPSYGCSVEMYRKYSLLRYPSAVEIEVSWTRIRKALS